MGRSGRFSGTRQPAQAPGLHHLLHFHIMRFSSSKVSYIVCPESGTDAPKLFSSREQHHVG